VGAARLDLFDDGTSGFADEFPFHLAGEDNDFGEFGHG